MTVELPRAPLPPFTREPARLKVRATEYRLVKDRWPFTGKYDGLMRRRETSVNDMPIAASDRRFLWIAPLPRPEGHPRLVGAG